VPYVVRYSDRNIQAANINTDRVRDTTSMPKPLSCVPIAPLFKDDNGPVARGEDPSLLPSEPSSEFVAEMLGVELEIGLNVTMGEGESVKGSSPESNEDVGSGSKVSVGENVGSSETVGSEENVGSGDGVMCGVVCFVVDSFGGVNVGAGSGGGTMVSGGGGAPEHTSPLRQQPPPATQYSPLGQKLPSEQHSASSG